MKNQKLLIALLFVIMLTSLSSCAPSGYESHESGFFSGLWHGFIFIFSLIGKLFGADIGIYAEHNTGFTYWLGFIIGIGGLGGGGYSASRR
jgi:hypothetical protein